MAINTLFERSDFQNGIDVNLARLPDKTVNRDGPGPGAKIPGQAYGFIFVRAEFVIIVVIRNVFQRVGFFRGVYWLLTMPESFSALPEASTLLGTTISAS